MDTAPISLELWKTYDAEQRREAGDPWYGHLSAMPTDLLADALRIYNPKTVIKSCTSQSHGKINFRHWSTLIKGQMVTDKDFTHNYYDAVYEKFLSPIRYNVRSVCEIGIGGFYKEMNWLPGNSLKVWRDYFPNAQIIGGDIDKDILFEEERIKTFYIDQTNLTSVQDFWNKVDLDNFDLILDDGLHTTDAGIKLFTQSYEKLSPLGFYIIEDVGMHMFPDYIDYFKNKSFKVEYINLNRRNTKIGNNSLVVIRKATEL
jgi:hypothetical protein